MMMLAQSCMNVTKLSGERWVTIECQASCENRNSDDNQIIIVGW